MGHTIGGDHRYSLLQRRFDRQLTGAPPSPAFLRILELLFSPEEAELARQLPSRPTPIGRLARKLKAAPAELETRLADLARRGLVVDLEHEGTRYFCLPPVVVGFYEFLFMRTRDDVPLSELARLFDEYTSRPEFVGAVFQGPTHIARSLVREETLPDHTEILDWERASQLIRSARAVGVSLCVCRHKASHLGQACRRPQRCCLSLNFAAQSLIRTGHAEPVTAREALQIVQECKQAGLAQTADNVQRRVTYLCNCCRCCCGLVQAIRQFRAAGAILSSGWIARVDRGLCRGCGRCAEACPVEAIRIGRAGGEREGHAVPDPAICLGCGVCASVCRSGAVAMHQRAQRVIPPETVFDRAVMMALERGKLADLLFEAPERPGPRAWHRLFQLIERSPPVRQALALRPLRSAFLGALVSGAKTATGRLREILQ